MTPQWYEALVAKRDQNAAAFEFAKHFLAAAEEDRNAILGSWDAQLSWTLPNPWRLACTEERPGTSRERIIVDLLFQALGFSQSESREATLVLAIVYNSCLLTGLDPKSIFNEIAERVTGPARDALIAFAARDVQDQSLAAFMLTAVEDPAGGFEIKADW